METFYEIWNVESRNRFGEYDTQDEAIEAVRRVVAVNGASAVSALALNSDDGSGRGVIIARGSALAALAGSGGTQGGASPASATPAPRRGSALADVGRMGIDASAILGSLSAANNASRMLASFNDVAGISRAANEAFLRIATVPNLSFYTTDIASQFRSQFAVTALSSLTSDTWERCMVQQSVGLRQMAESINANALAGIMAGILEATEINRARLVEVATQIAQQCSAAPQIGTYVLPMPDEPQMSFVLEHTEDEDFLAAVAIDKQVEDRKAVVLLWRVDENTLVNLAG